MNFKQLIDTDRHTRTNHRLMHDLTWSSLVLSLCNSNLFEFRHCDLSRQAEFPRKAMNFCYTLPHLQPGKHQGSSGFAQSESFRNSIFPSAYSALSVNIPGTVTTCVALSRSCVHAPGYWLSSSLSYSCAMHYTSLYTRRWAIVTYLAPEKFRILYTR